MQRIDLNCDLGEGAGFDAELMPLVTSANIACGAHAGDVATMRSTVELARKHGVAIGAHPGFADPKHFGRRELPVGAEAVRALVTEQITLLRAMTSLRHVKPHGALYNLAARDAAIAGAIVEAVRAIDPALILFAPAASELARAGTAGGLRVAHEIFADRTYQPDGRLTSRSQAGALIEDADIALEQVMLMLREGVVRTTEGTTIPIRADTICLHGDGPQAVTFARRLNRELKKSGIELKAFDA